MENKTLLKQLSQGKESSRPSKGYSIPGVDQLKKLVGKASTKQVVDLALFSAGIFLMYKFGKSVAETIDNQMPTEKSIMDMMKSNMGGPMPMPM